MAEIKEQDKMGYDSPAWVYVKYSRSTSFNDYVDSLNIKSTTIPGKGKLTQKDIDKINREHDGASINIIAYSTDRPIRTIGPFMFLYVGYKNIMDNFATKQCLLQQVVKEKSYHK